MLTIKGGKIWENGCFQQNDTFRLSVHQENREITLLDDDLITPGLVDFHSHLWSPLSVSQFGVDADRLYSQGIVALQEPGSFGCSNWQDAQQFWSNSCQPFIKSFMHVIPNGFSIFPPEDPIRPEKIDVDSVIEKAIQAKMTGKCQGVKIHLGWLPYKDAATDYKFLEIARRVADAANLKMMVHISGQCIDTNTTFSMLKAGDVITHIFSGLSHNILDDNGQVLPSVYDAKKRGVLFDIGAAGKHFHWDTFRAANAQGLDFDFIGSDITMTSWQNGSNRPAYNLFYCISGLLNSGVTLDKAFQCAIDKPAAFMDYTPDYSKNCLIIKKEDETYHYADALNSFVDCNYVYLPRLFIGNNKLVREWR